MGLVKWKKKYILTIRHTTPERDISEAPHPKEPAWQCWPMRLDESETRRRFAASPVARLASVDDHGHPHLVPVTFAAYGDTVATAIDHKPKSTTYLKRLANITANPEVCLLVDHYADDWEHLWWARADGTARIAAEGDDRTEALAYLVDRYAPYRETPPEGPVVLVHVRRWSGWSFR